MGEKSLLSILEEEKRIVDEIRFKKSDMLDLLEETEKNSDNRDTLKSKCGKMSKEVQELEKKLIAVRREMKSYINFIVRL